MYREEGCILSGNVEDIIQRLNDCGYCMAGMPAEHEKMKVLPTDVYEEICKYADVVLVEADGSKGMPVKFPASHEPVVPENVDEIYIVTGLCVVGKILKEVCHRKELVQECLGVSEETALTEEHLRKLLQKGYLEPLKTQYPKTKLSVWFNDYKKN
jgi:xanthine dehydrogenase accessory factor